MEKPNSKGSDNFIVGLFVGVAVLVISGFIVFMGGASSLTGESTFKARFRDVRGLNTGAPVFMSGIQIGRVSKFYFPEGEGIAIETEISVYREHQNRIRKNTVASISTQGVLGDKVVTLNGGSPDSPALEKGGYMDAEIPKELSDYFSKGGDLVENLNRAVGNLNVLLEEVRTSGHLPRTLARLETATDGFAKIATSLTTPDNLGPALASLRKILDKVEKGEGTLGALVNDPALHEDLRILLGGAQRSKLVRFMLRQAISSGEKAAETGELTPQKNQ
jgi:phospholipid/cholesterol/gamma-HCH transport system substrate-binding protein